MNETDFAKMPSTGYVRLLCSGHPMSEKVDVRVWVELPQGHKYQADYFCKSCSEKLSRGEDLVEWHYGRIE